MPSSILFNDTSALNNSLILQKFVHLRLIVSVIVFIIIVLGRIYFDWALNYPLIGITLAIGFVWSAWLTYHLRSKPNITEMSLLREIIFDGIWLLVIVLLTGRSANPFIYYFLVLIAISATIFKRYICWPIIGCIIAAYSLMLLWDIKDHFNHMGGDYQLHLLGMWINFVGSAVVVGYFVSKLAFALGEYQLQLSQAREQTLRNEHLIGIGTLAASTVHALGTPLSTLTILLSEKMLQTTNEEDSQDLNIMLSQIERCKNTMKKLSLLAEQEESGEDIEQVNDLVNDLKEHYGLVNPEISPRFSPEKNILDLPLKYSLLLRHALINLIDNAVQAAHKAVEITFKNEDNTLCIFIADDGPPIPNNIVNMWGNPVQSEKHEGLGIGIFLANSTIEKLGGSVLLFKQSNTDSSSPPSKSLHIKIMINLPLDSHE